LAEKAGLKIIENGSIWVDDYMRTDAEDIFADRSGFLLGGQVSGGPSVGELINLIALAIQKKVTVRELDMMQIATHPLLTSAPTLHPVISAAHQALAKLRARIKSEPEAILKIA
jgi:pyruvate/2-oxoglutarate dehydrogenase complex dihydrolipoamide dehydrogenase (E3) component